MRNGAIRISVGKELTMVVLDRIALALVIIGALRIVFVFLKDLLKNSKNKPVKHKKNIKTKESASALAKKILKV